MIYDEPSKLSQDAAAARAAGTSYGKWKALQGEQPIVPGKKSVPPGYKVCVHCGKLFLALGTTKLYCDASCSQRARNARRRKSKERDDK